MHPIITAALTPAVTQVVTPETVTVTMPRDHAETLLIVSRLVGGHPSGRRGHIDNLVEALQALGLSHRPFEVVTPEGCRTVAHAAGPVSPGSSIYFNN